MRDSFILALVFFSLVCNAQNIQNLDASFNDGNVIITYDLPEKNPNRTYYLKVFSSRDNFTNPLQEVTGDVGEDITIGTNKKIVWNAAKELGTFDGELIFKLKGEMNALPLVLINPTNNRKIKKGKELSIKWQGGKSDSKVKLGLYQEDVMVTSLGEQGNTGSYNWRVPKKFNKGEFIIKLSSGNEIVQSSIVVKSSSKLLLIGLPVVAVGAAVAVLAGGGDGSDLPAPPEPK
jgi:hypothetical protein